MIDPVSLSFLIICSIGFAGSIIYEAVNVMNSPINYSDSDSDDEYPEESAIGMAMTRHY